jgi:hypothetical protein
MIIFPRRTAHRLRRVLGAYGVDSVVHHALRHQFDEIGPDPQPTAAMQLVTRPMRVDPVAEEHFRAIHVAHTGQDGLIHQQCGDRPSRAVDPAPGKIRIGIGSQWIWT